MYKIRKPKKVGDLYGWQESFADGSNDNYVINSLVYQRMNKYLTKDGISLFKYYNTEYEALQDYFTGAKSLLVDVLKGKRNKGYYGVYGSILSDMIYTMENS